jgi:hypothetical protein
MGAINQLLEGANPYKNLQNQAGKLAGKWGKSGLLEGISSSTEKNNMAILLENQAKQLVNEASSTTPASGLGTATSVSGNAGEAWAGVALPLVRRVFGEIVAKDLISVQPMNLPAGLIFYLDFQYGTGAQNFKAADESLYGATSDLKRTDSGFDKGLYGAGEFGYSISQSTQDVTYNSALGENQYATASADFGGIINADSEFSQSYAGQFNGTVGATSVVKTLKVRSQDLTNADLEAVRGFEVSGASNISGSFPAFTRVNGDNVEFVVSAAADTALGTLTVSFLKGPDNLNNRGDFEDSIPAASTSTQVIPEINVQMRSETVAAKTRKLKAQWTPEFAQDLNAYHSIDAEAELTSILSEYISMEIDLEILDMLIKNADTVEAWSAKVATNATVSSNHTAGGTTAVTVSQATDTTNVYYTKMSWFQTLGIKLQKVSNLIHQKTLRGGANWMVCGPKISTVLESIPGFAADSAGDEDKYNMGVQKVGAINNRYTVYKNPYMTENIILMGYKGSQFLETGAVFAPYIPLIMTPLVYDPVSFTPRKGIMTRYAKKMVRPDFYGKVIISELDEV